MPELTGVNTYERVELMARFREAVAKTRLLIWEYRRRSSGKMHNKSNKTQ